MKTDFGHFTGTAASRLIASHQSTAQFTAGAFIALCIATLALIFAAAAQVAPAAV